MAKKQPAKEPEYITIKDFAARIDISYGNARDMVTSKFFWDKGLSCNINIHENKNGGMRVNWAAYVAELEKQKEIPKTNKRLLWVV